MTPYFLNFDFVHAINLKRLTQTHVWLGLSLVRKSDFNFKFQKHAAPESFSLSLEGVKIDVMHVRMKNLKMLSNHELLEKTKSLAAEERRITTSVLWHLHEIQSRRLYAEQGFSSLFEYAVKELGYSDAAAGRRIAAMKVLVTVPEVEPALESGKTSLSTLCTLQSFFQNQEEPMSASEKKELVLALQGTSRRECEKKLAVLDPKPFQKQDRERVLTDTLTEVRFVADEQLLEKLKKIQELDAHFQSHPSYLELFHRMADLCLKKLNVTEKKAKATPQDNNAQVNLEPNSAPDPRAISTEVRRQVWRRDQGKCQFKGPTGKICASEFALQIDHINPVAWGGQARLTNLQLLCRTHNQWKAIRQLGRETILRHHRK